MKKSIKIIITVLVIIMFAFIQNAYNQIVFDSGWEPDSVAYISVEYKDTVLARTDSSKLPITYSLVRPLNGMLINSSTGIITWTPGDVDDGGVVIVKATNNDNEHVTKEFVIYLSTAIPCPASLEAYWKLDEVSGPVYYDWVGTNNASEDVNSPQNVTGIVDDAQNFDQTNLEGLSVPFDPVFNWGVNDEFTIELWFKNSIPQTDSAAHVFIGRNEGSEYGYVHWWMGYLADSTINFIVRRTSTGNFAQCQSSIIMDTEWHYVAAVRRPAPTDQISLYIDGLLIDSDSYDGSGAGLISEVPLNIGFLEPDTGKGTRFPYNGSIDEVRIHNKALETSEIIKNFSAGLNGKPACKDGNFVPTFTSIPVDTAREEQAYTYQVTAKDLDLGDVITYSVISKPSWLDYDGGTKTFSGTPGNSNVGDDQILITITDSKDTVEQEFTLHVINANDDPEITSSPLLTVDEESLYSYQVTASDIDIGDNLVFSAPVKPGWLSINGSTGLLTGTPPVDDTTEYNITVRVTDDSAAYDEQSYILDILNINDPPEITGQKLLETDEDNSILIGLDDIYYTDVDNGPSDLTLTVQDGTNYSHIGNLVTPALNYHGEINVPVELSDLEFTDDYILDITVNSVNDTPRIVVFPATLNAFEDQQYKQNFKAVDDDADDEVEYSVVEKPEWLSVEPFSDYLILIGTPQFEDIGENTLILMFSDDEVDIDTTLVITVNLTNNIPYITSTPTSSVDEDIEYIYNVTYTDDDPGDNVTLSVVTKPGWLNLNGNVLSGTPTNDQVGMEPSVAYTVKLRVYDGKQDSTQTFKVTVNNVNDAPEITGQPDTLLTYAGTSLVIGLSDIIVTDVDNVTGDLSVMVLPGSHYVNSGDTAKIDADAPYIIHVNVRVTDGELQSLTYSVNVKVFGGTGIGELMQTNSLVTNVYPVPANEYMIFEINSNSDVNFELLSLQGQVVIYKKIYSNEDLIKLDISDLPSGIYAYRIYNNKLYQTGKVSIQN